ncbi:MAG: hypothetical protein GX347_08820 [Epulopiscium sp.]|nr:hypothetical protein [Candidatus Epulonipiscium sp.]
MSELFTKNIGLKIISLLSAILLWFIVINIENPVTTQNFNHLEVQVKHQEEVTSRRKAIKFLEGKTVSVTIRGKRLELEKLRKSDIIVTADIELINEYGAVEIEVWVPEQFEIVRKTPTHMKVELEDVVTVQKNISYDLIGEPASGYIIQEGVIKPTNSLSITGPKSQVSKIATVLVPVDVREKKKDISIYAEPIAYDQDGNEILGLDKSIEQVEVYIPIKKLKTVPLQIGEWQTNPPDGYVIIDSKIEPSQVMIMGDEAVINQIQSIQLPSMDVSNVTSTTVFTQDIRSLLPQNVVLYEQQKEAKITVQIQKEILREFQIPMKEINVQRLPEGLQFRFVTRDDIPILVTGLEKDIYRVNTHSLHASIDLSGYKIGNHQVEVFFDLPKGVRLIGDPPTISVELLEGDEEISREEILKEES